MAKEWEKREFFRQPAYIHRCLEENPTTFVTTAAIGSLALLASAVLCIRHSRSLDTRPLGLLRTLYHGILAFPIVWAFFSWASLLTPLARPLAELFMGQSEAFALHSFMVILFMLVSVESLKRREPGPDEVSASSLDARRTVIQTLQEYGPQKYFAVPPFGCCFKCCTEAHHITAKQLLWVSRLVRQYVFVQVFMNAYFLWAKETLDPKMWDVGKWSEPILKLSGMLAMYGLFVMYTMTYDLLRNWNTTKKFTAVKLMVALGILQGKLFAFLVPVLSPERNCWVDPTHPKDLDRLVSFWMTFVTLLETVPMAWLITKAFPASDVSDYPLKQMDLLELELRALAQP